MVYTVKVTPSTLFSLLWYLLAELQACCNTTPYLLSACTNQLEKKEIIMLTGLIFELWPRFKWVLSIIQPFFTFL